MSDTRTVRVAVNGYGVIGKRVAAAVASQPDMSLAGVSDVVTDWRARIVTRNGFRLFGATAEHAAGMRAAGLDISGTLEDLIGQADVVVDCTPIARFNESPMLSMYRGGFVAQSESTSRASESGRCRGTWTPAPAQRRCRASGAQKDTARAESKFHRSCD